jgi:uncharacterized OB-fold protein
MTSDVIHDDESVIYIDGLRRGVLRIRRCMKCGHLGPPPDAVCRQCHCPSVTWIDSAGRGRVIAGIVDHQLSAGSHVLALIELDEGPWVLAEVSSARTAPPRGTPVTLRVHRADSADCEPILAFVPSKNCC